MKLELAEEKTSKLRALPVQMIEQSDGVVLKRGCTEFKIAGPQAARATAAILSATCGRDASVDEIAGLFAATDRLAVEQLIKNLVARRILIDSTSAPPTQSNGESPLDIFYWDIGENTEAISKRLNEKNIALIGLNAISRQIAKALHASEARRMQAVDYPLLRNLRLFGSDEQPILKDWPIQEVPVVAYEEWTAQLHAGEIPGVVVATSDIGGSHLLRQWNRFCVDNKVLFLPVVLQDLCGQIGPLVVPGETPCYECLRARQNANLEDPVSYRATEPLAPMLQSICGLHPSMASVLGDLAAMELIKFIGGKLAFWKVGHFIDVNLTIPELSVRKVLRVPGCAVCGLHRASSPTSLDKHSFVPAQKALA